MMWPEPVQPTANRMRLSFAQACTEMTVEPSDQGDPVWGWHGRTLSRPVLHGRENRWLRLAGARQDAIAPTFWSGSLDAQPAIPTSVPRPQLMAHLDFSCGDFSYRAELYERIDAPTITKTPMLTTDLDLPGSWWTGLHHALNTIAAVPTHRRTVEQRFLDTAMPHFLGEPITTTAPSPWITAHGDLHLANLCEPLCILDWEGWGLAPIGYDAAILHSYSLLVPASAARIRHEFADVLDTPDGTFAELVAITQLLRNAAAGDTPELRWALQDRAEHLLQREIPRPV